MYMLPDVPRFSLVLYNQPGSQLVLPKYLSYYYKENQPDGNQSNITWLLKFSVNVIFPIKQESDCIVSCATKETPFN